MKRGDTSPEKLSHKLLLSSMCRLKQQQQQQQQQQEEDHEAVSGVHDELRAIYRQYVPNKTVCSKSEVNGEGPDSREQQLLAEVQAKYIPSEGGGVEADYDVVGAVGAAGAAGAVESVDVVAGVVREE